MENATRALLMVAGVFFGLLIITMVLFMHNNISDYYESTEANKKTEQLATFNKQYSAYNRDDVRGSELLSLINKIIDFNDSKDIGEKEIQIKIEINLAREETKLFYYKYDDYNYKHRDKNVTLLKVSFIYNHKNIKGHLLDEANAIAAKFPTGTAEKLAANVSKLIIDKSLTDISKERAEKEREKFLNQLNIEPDSVNNNDILKYYQYQQFKRAHFDCEELKFTKDGRVESFRFVFNGKFQ